MFSEAAGSAKWHQFRIWGPRRSACTISYFAAIMGRCREASVSPRPLGASSPIGLESVNADCAEVAVVCSDDE